MARTPRGRIHDPRATGQLELRGRGGHRNQRGKLRVTAQLVGVQPLRPRVLLLYWPSLARGARACGGRRVRKGHRSGPGTGLGNAAAGLKRTRIVTGRRAGGPCVGLRRRIGLRRRV